MAIEKIEAGITGAEASGIIYENDLFLNDRIDAEAVTKKLKLGYGNNMFSASAVIPDTFVDGTSGLLTSETGYITSSTIPCDPSTTYYIAGLALESYNHGINYKNAAGDIIGFGYIGGAGDNIKPYFSFSTPPACISFQLTVKTMAPGDTTNVNSVYIAPGTLPTFLQPFEFGAQKISEVNLMALSYKGFKTRNLLNVADSYTGWIDWTSGMRNPDAAYKTSGIFRVNPLTYVTISGLDARSFSRGFVYRNAAGNILSYGLLSPANRMTLKVPENAYFLELTLKTGNPTDTTDLNNVKIEIGALATGKESRALKVSQIDGVDIVSSSPKTKGANMLLFGDSITTTKFSTTNWPTYAADILQLSDVLNYATSGAAYRDRIGVEDLQKISYQVTRAITDNAGYNPAIIVVNCGINDGIIDIGTYADAMAKTNIETLDRTKLYEAVRWAYWTLRIAYPNAFCISCLPLQSAFAEPTETLPNRQAIAEMAKRYNFFVIDQNSESGIIKDFETAGEPGRYLADGLHPNEVGKILQARFLSNKIETNYPR